MQLGVRGEVVLGGPQVAFFLRGAEGDVQRNGCGFPPLGVLDRPHS